MIGTSFGRQVSPSILANQSISGTQAKQLEYLYVESDGGFSRGIVSVQSGAVIFPPTTYVEAGHDSSYRSRWRQDGADAYDVVTEFKSGDFWKEGWRVHMVRNGAASP